ncbi:MAG: LapA family protein [Gemmatimonadota bacterium]
MQKILDRVRLLAVALMSSGIVLFAWQNRDSVEVHFLAWWFEVPVSLLTLVPILAALLIGVWSGLIRRRRKKAAKAAKATEPIQGEVPALIEEGEGEGEGETALGSEGGRRGAEFGVGAGAGDEVDA